MKLDTSYDIPYLAGYSKDGTTIYIDKDVPRTFLQGDKRGSTYKYLLIHERKEKALMDAKGYNYQLAHQEALQAEREAVEADGFDWAAYNGFMETWIKKTGDKRLRNVPGDLDLKPYHDSRDVETMKHIEQAAAKRLSKSAQKELDALRSRLDMLNEAMRRVPSMPKKREMKAEAQRIKDRMTQIKKETASSETASTWPKDFFTVMVKVSTTQESESPFSEKGATVTIRGHYDASSVDEGTMKSRPVPVVKHTRDIVKHDLTVQVYHPTKSDLSFRDTDKILAHTDLVGSIARKAAKQIGIKFAPDGKAFLASAKKGNPTVTVIPHPAHGFEVVLTQDAEQKAWKK